MNHLSSFRLKRNEMERNGEISFNKNKCLLVGDSSAPCGRSE